VLGLIVVNLRRRLARTLLTAVGIAVGVAMIVALLALTAGLERSAGSLLHLGKANFGLFQSGTADLTSSALPQSLVARVRSQPGVSTASPIQLVTGAVPREPSLLVFGIEPDGFVAQRLVLTAGRRPAADEALLGDEAAKRLKLGPGDTIRLKGRPFAIAGVYHAGVAFEDAGAALSLAQAQRLVGRTDQVTTIAVRLTPTTKAKTIAKRFRAIFPGTVAITEPGELARADTNSLLIRKAVTAIALLALIIGGISVTNTMLLAVLERRVELGVLAAVGWSPRQVATLIFGEGLAVSVLGAGIGLGLGVAAGELIVRALSATAFVSPAFTAWGFGRGLLVGIAIGVLGGLYPAWRVTRLRPAEALAG